MRMCVALLLGLSSAALAESACPPLPGYGLPPGVFALHEMDLHLHAGMERPVPLTDWLDYAAKDGRKVVVLLDHLELYRKSPEEYRQWRDEGKFQAEYPVGAAGHDALMKDFAQAGRRQDLIVFTGWEVYEGELDTGVEAEALRRVDLLGWHISPNNGREAPNGQTLLRRAQQLKDLQKDFPVPMVLFHPFTMRIENLQRTAQREGRDSAAITAEQYRFFQPGEQEQLAEILRGSSIYIEISNSTGHYWDQPACRAALIADIRPLAEQGVQFIVSTDAHSVKHAEEPFRPESYCTELGVTPENTNTIVRELLAIRAKSP